MRTPYAERHNVETKTGELSYHLWRGSGKHAKSTEALLVLLHGWLGAETMHFVAGELAASGHDVAVVDQHTRAGIQTILHPNKRRSVDAHHVTKDAALRTGKHIVHLIDHSNGNQDALHMTEHALSHGAPYRVRAIGAIAGVGMNGKHVHVHDFVTEAAENIPLLAHHPREEIHALGITLRNYVTNPILALEEGLFAMRVDCRQGYRALLEAGQLDQVTELYFDHDHLIPPPATLNGALVLSGSHMTPIVEPEAMRLVADRLAA